MQQDVPGAPEAGAVKKREIFGWAMYDVANSSFTTVVVTVVYSAFFVNHVVPQGSAMRDSLWSTVILLSTIATLFLSPFVGVMTDLSGRKKEALRNITFLCCAATAGLFFAGPGDVWLAMLFVSLGLVAFNLSESLCGAFLSDLAGPGKMAKLSGLGWGLGYFGGLASLVVVQQIVQADASADPASFIRQNQLAMVSTAAFFALAALPTLLFLRNRRAPRAAPGTAFAARARMGLAELKHNLRAGLAAFRGGTQAADAPADPRTRRLFRFLTAFMVYMAGVDIVIKFVGIYAVSELKFETKQMAVMFIILQLSAAGGAMGFGWLEGLVGPKRTVLLTLFLWVIGILAIYLLPTLEVMTGFAASTLFFCIAFIAGLGLGATQSSSRAIVGLIADPERSSEMFGYWGMFSRFATLLGASFGFVSDAVGRRPALLLVVFFLIAGAALLAPMKFQERDQRTA